MRAVSGGNDALWSMVATVEESQRRPLGFWSKAMPLGAENVTPFDKTVWALVKGTSDRSPQVTAWPS